MISKPKRSDLAPSNLFSAALIIAGLALFLAAALYPFSGLIAQETSLGQSLEVRIWADIMDKKMESIESKIAPGFISVHPDGARDRAEELELIRGLNLGKYALTDFVVTRQGPAIIVSYMVSVEETIMGKRLSSEPAARLSVWLMTDKGWQWISHANLNPLKQQEN